MPLQMEHLFSIEHMLWELAETQLLSNIIFAILKTIMTEETTSKTTEEPGAVPKQAPAPQPSSLGLASMILGIVSFTGPGFLLGIPAIIMAAIDLKKQPANRGF